MLNRSESLAMSTSVLKALPGKLDIKRNSPSILYITPTQNMLVCYMYVYIVYKEICKSIKLETNNFGKH